MKIRHAVKAVAILILIARSAALSAKDDAQPIPALKPEVQTAEWAQRWWMPRHRQKLAELKKMDKVDLLMIGDSGPKPWNPW